MGVCAIVYVNVNITKNADKCTKVIYHQKIMKKMRTHKVYSVQLIQNLNFDYIHINSEVACAFKHFLSLCYCRENFDIYENVLKYENLFLCSCFSSKPSAAISPSAAKEETGHLKRNQKSHNTITNLQHLQDTTNFKVCCKCTDSTKIEQLIHYIGREYISNNSDNQVNLTGRTKKILISKIRNLDKRSRNKNKQFPFYIDDMQLFGEVKLEVE